MGRFRVKAEVISLGCRLNISESERMRAMLADAGDVVVVNSCAVTSEAVRQTRQAIRKARRARPDARLIVTGCAADIEREQLGQMPEVDGLIANAAKAHAGSTTEVNGLHLTAERTEGRRKRVTTVLVKADQSLLDARLAFSGDRDEDE